MKSKTLILSSQKKFETNSPRAILTFVSNNNQVEGKLRLYNMQTLPNNSKLGVYYDEKVYTANLIKKDDAWNFFIDHDFNLDKNIYCAIVDRAHNNDVVLCGGNSNGFMFSESEEDEEEEKADNLHEEEINNEIQDDAIIPTADTQTIKNAENCTNCDICEKCAYKEYFYSQTNSSSEMHLEESKQETVVQSSDSINNLNEGNVLSYESEKFLHAITDQLDDMFKTYPEDTEIMKIIPNSKIIKVTDSIDDSCYIVGIIYEDNEIKYLLYGVPAKYNDTPPQEIGKNYQWLPIDTEDPMSDGYFVIYQDTDSGKIVPIKVE